MNDLTSFLCALFDRAPTDSFIEVRYRVAAGMGQTFVPTTQPNLAEDAVLHHGYSTDVYVGVLPRSSHSGRREHIVPAAQVVWADCDSDESVSALAAFRPRPSMMVRSGTGNNCHAYWLLVRPASLDAIEDTNRRLAVTIGSDGHSVDATRILRPPLTINHKCGSANPVSLGFLNSRSRVNLDEVTENTHKVPPRLRMPPPPGRITDDPLLTISPKTYVESLTGEDVSIAHKIRCPFHADDTPSLHVYRSADRGWMCYGCGRGGTIYDFAALTWNSSTRGAEFLILRQRLSEIFLSGPLRQSGYG